MVFEKFKATGECISLNIVRRNSKTDNMVWLLCICHYLPIFIFSVFIAAVVLLSNNYLIIDQQKDFFAYAHIFIDTPNTITKDIDNYQIVFLPYPNNPIANDNSTRLNFSLMENKTDVYNVFVSLIIKDKRSENVVVEQIPYKFYEFGDITFPYTFRNVSDYVVSFQARINGDPKYKVTPLIANFDISVVKPGEIPFNVWVISLTPIVAAIAGIVIYFDFFRKRNNGGRRNAYLVCIF
jgi:hypothetical protein